MRVTKQKHKGIRELSAKKITGGYFLETIESDAEEKGSLLTDEQIVTTPQDLIVAICNFFDIPVAEEETLKGSVLEV